MTLRFSRTDPRYWNELMEEVLDGVIAQAKEDMKMIEEPGFFMGQTPVSKRSMRKMTAGDIIALGQTDPQAAAQVLEME